MRHQRVPARRQAARVLFAALVSTVMLAGTLAAPATAASRRAGILSSWRPWWCTATEDVHMHMDDPVAMAAYPDPKGPLSWHDCFKVTADLFWARLYAVQYPTARDAEAAGFRKVVPYAAGMGTHHLTPEGLDPGFDPRRPNSLMYGGNGPDAPLVGMMWSVLADTPPAGFPGGNDHWHRHPPLCFQIRSQLIVGQGLTDQQCAARGGVNLDVSRLWMAHAWVVPGWEYHPDVFAAHNPDLGWPPPAA